MFYDALNRPWKVLLPEVTRLAVNATEQTVRPETTTWYDENGNVYKVRDAEMRETVNEYDWHNRLKHTTGPEGIVTQYSFDKSGNRLTVTDGLNRTNTLTYDGLNRVITNTPPNGAALVNEYDVVNLVKRTDPNGNVTRFAEPVEGCVLRLEWHGSRADSEPWLQL